MGPEEECKTNAFPGKVLLAFDVFAAPTAVGGGITLHV
jgi:hypothetical protein